MSNDPPATYDMPRVPDLPPGAGWGPGPGRDFTSFDSGDGDGTNWQSQFHHYWQLLLTRRWLIVAAALLGLIVAAVRTFREPRRYTAQSTVEFKQAIAPGKDLDIMQRRLFIPPELAQRLLTTKVLAARTIKLARENGDDWFTPSPAAPTEQEPSFSIFNALTSTVNSALSLGVRTMRELLGGTSPPQTEEPSVKERRDWDGVDVGIISAYYGFISIRPVQMTSIVDIVVTHADPVIAAKLANYHAEAFVQMDIDTKAESLSDAQGLFMRQLQEVRKQLDAGRKALSEYQIDHGILTLPNDESTITRQSAKQLNKLLVQAQAERISAEANYRTAAASTPERLAETLNDRGLQALRDEILQLRARYAAQLQDYGSNHPDMAAMQAQIDSLSHYLETAAAQARERLRGSYEAALAREKELLAKFVQVSKDASVEDRELIQLIVLQRDVESSGQLYASLLEQAKQSDLVRGTFQWTNVSQIDRAVPPLVPSYPQTQRSLMQGLLIGLLIGVVLAVFVDRLDTSIHTPEDLTSFLGLPSLGVIPDFNRLAAAYGYSASRGRVKEVDTDPNLHGDLITLTSPASVVSEAYRTVRTNLMFSSPGHPPRTVLVTSSQAGEGKTITTVNLAVSLALSGARVVVIDADMRKPSCHVLLQVPQEPGLSNVLTGQCDIHTAVVRSPVSPAIAHWGQEQGLFILPSGRIPPNPSELLSSGVMTKLLSDLAEHFEYVLVDSPPVLPVSDSVALAPKMDSVIFVVREGKWARDVIRRAMMQLRSVRARTLGALLNCVDVGRGGSSYYYYRRYYGYGSYAHHYGQQAGNGGPATPT
jgi:capsular exopolysaccharide synthesis family protein